MAFLLRVISSRVFLTATLRLAPNSQCTRNHVRATLRDQQAVLGDPGRAPDRPGERSAQHSGGLARRNSPAVSRTQRGRALLPVLPVRRERAALDRQLRLVRGVPLHTVPQDRLPTAQGLRQRALVRQHQSAREAGPDRGEGAEGAGAGHLRRQDTEAWRRVGGGGR